MTPGGHPGTPSQGGDTGSNPVRAAHQKPPGEPGGVVDQSAFLRNDWGLHGGKRPVRGKHPSGRGWVETGRLPPPRAPLPEVTCPMDIVRNADGTLVVPVQPERPHDTDDDADASSGEADRAAAQ